MSTSTTQSGGHPLRYALVGTGSRAFMFRDALAGPHAAQGRIVALCDINPLRADAWQTATNASAPATATATKKLPVYAPGDFEKMLKDERIDRVIVTTMDRTHHHYICAAMRAGCDVISEKPMTTDADKCAQILRTMRETGRHLRVTFNYRYAPRNSKVKELLAAGAIGDVLSVHFEWMLDTKHGADYFRRWHRDKRNSGGLLVHKATHHFDLVNWWLNTVPETVFAMGGLRFYGRENAEARGQIHFCERSKDLPPAALAADPFALDLRAEPRLKALYLDAEPADGYVRDRNVFNDGISIEDDMGVMVSYRNRAVMTYHLTAYSPWEGYRVSFNGTKGRLEYEVVEKAYVSGTDKDHNLARNLKIGDTTAAAVPEPVTLLLRPHWAPPVRIQIPETNEGGHGGGDARMLRDIFEDGPGAEPDPLGRAAGVRDGLYSVLCGAAGNHSLATGQPVRLADLVPGLPE
ncbi:Gfo/Idh/MocA family oxidoreductase [Geminisphaera colitermitum]|uniref:Gfo/Idh/MocA family oxidoreductase n=1 Tax=Geminisphaera colitermitum TaxID=1148786 RepID=UPI0001965432|nr:Gfo/Idh/MocA family oxidoreductase [Geminisphaera colitermitum]